MEVTVVQMEGAPTGISMVVNTRTGTGPSAQVLDRTAEVVLVGVGGRPRIKVRVRGGISVGKQVQLMGQAVWVAAVVVVREATHQSSQLS